jgi:hypothetical protein
MSVLSSGPQVQSRTEFSFPLHIAHACSTVLLIDRSACRLTSTQIHGASDLTIGTFFACEPERQT